MRYRFFVDGRPQGALRATWAEAVDDAVRAGYAHWVGHNRQVMRIDTNQGAEIRRVK